jgi:hypothetical protein
MIRWRPVPVLHGRGIGRIGGLWVLFGQRRVPLLRWCHVSRIIPALRVRRWRLVFLSRVVGVGHV